MQEIAPWVYFPDLEFSMQVKSDGLLNTSCVLNPISGVLGNHWISLLFILSKPRETCSTNPALIVS